MTKRPSEMEEEKKPAPSTKGASGEPSKAEAKGPAPSALGSVALEARGQRASSGFAILGPEVKTAAQGFAPPPTGLAGAEVKTEAEPFAVPQPASTQGQPLVPIGITTLGATISPMSLKAGSHFSNDKELLSWLNTQPHEVSVIIAARAALRVLPVAARELPAEDGGRFSALISAMFWATALARVAAKYPTRTNELRTTSVVSRHFFTTAAATDRAAVAATLAAAATHADATTAAAYAGNAAAAAVVAAAAVADPADAFAWTALSNDADFISQGGAVAELADRPLWPSRVIGSFNTVPFNEMAINAFRRDGTPPWAAELWTKLKAALPPGEDWEVWTRWYDERLAGAPSRGEAYELAFATVPLPEWEAGYAAANRWIKEHLPPEPQPVELPPIESLPAQIFAAVQFSEGGAGPIDVVRDPATSDPTEAEDQREHYTEARRKALHLQSLGGNTLGDLQQPVAQLLEVMPDDMGALSIVKLWHRANTLRKRLVDHELAVERQRPGSEPDPAMLAYAAAGPLRDFVESYNIFIVGDAKGRELDRKSLGPGERERDEAAIAAMESVIAALRSTPDVATEAVSEILQELSNAAKSAPKSLAGDQDVALARDSEGNFLIALICKTYRLIADEVRVATSKGAREKVYATAITTAGVAYLPAAARLIAESFDALKAFASLVYNNPSISQMIDAITQHLLRGHI